LIAFRLLIHAPCNDRKISELKKYNLIFLSNFFNGIIPMDLNRGQINEYQCLAHANDGKMTVNHAI
jgi:hypothetical protein